MPIICVGISHRRTPVELLERLTFSEHDLLQTYENGLPALRITVAMTEPPAYVALCGCG